LPQGRTGHKLTVIAGAVVIAVVEEDPCSASVS